ncbi:MAG: acetyl-CoA synthetase [Rhodospirillales bacterium]|nr:acetyl-CoA synthetase [Rhodospirillales bacterium]|tara:strand:- start:211 stop:1761 length:1551 start_codon:yes stop_codon:yes gene_type:complete
MDYRKSNLGYFNSGAADTYPNKTALIDLSGTKVTRITHGQLSRRMTNVASMLLNIGVKQGERLLLGMGNRSEFIEIFFGSMRAGIIPIPLNIKLGAKTIDFIIKDSDCRAAIIEPDCNEDLVEVIENNKLQTLIALNPVPHGWLDYEHSLETFAQKQFGPSEFSHGEIAFLPYTSGSTGLPKGVLLTHEGMLWGIKSSQKYWPSSHTDRALVAGPLFHKNAMRVSIKPKLFVGGSAVILPHFEPKLMLNALAKYKCTETGGVPAMYRMMLAETKLLQELEFPYLRCLEMGSAVVGADLLKAVEKAFDAEVEEAYGLTEGGGPLRAPTDGRYTPRGSCGVPAPGVAVKLVEDSGLESAKQGELWVKSPAVLYAYNERPDLTKERLSDGWLHTGDIFKRDDQGFFYFLGRIDDQFSCGGENIYPKEVELLLVQHPDIIDAVVIPIKHEVKGLAPAALVTVRPKANINEQAIKNFTLKHGAAYAHPRHVIFIDKLPIGGTGKVDRQAVKLYIEEFLGSN